MVTSIPIPDSLKGIDLEVTLYCECNYNSDCIPVTINLKQINQIIFDRGFYSLCSLDGLEVTKGKIVLKSNPLPKWEQLLHTNQFNNKMKNIINK